MTSLREELLQLVDCQIEDQLTDASQLRLTELLSANPGLITDYTEYIFLHGQLYWDAGLCTPSAIPPAVTAPATDSPTLVRRMTTDVPVFTETHRSGLPRRLLAVSATLLAVLSGWFVVTQRTPISSDVVVRPPTTPRTDSPIHQTPVVAANDISSTPDLVPLELHKSAQPTVSVTPPATDVTKPRYSLPTNFDDDLIVSTIDQLLQASWQNQNVEPSPLTTDSEWIRRLYLTLMGRVPTLDESERFLASRSPRKRLSLIDSVTTDSERASHFAVVWTNLLIGRTKRPGVNREALFEFLSQQFGDNSPWIDTVKELITATGRNDQNGATNFLLAHLNNQATPATAVTSRLFLGEQISCVQCHDHPFSKEVRQQDYWAFNAFFKDTDRKTVLLANAAANQKMADVPWRLLDRPREDRMTYYETRSGLEKAVLPEYDGQAMSRDSRDNRREELARLLATDSDARVARAMVNRLWDHFFGYGFTTPMDDMGPHATVSHPQLLNLLTEAFVKSNYDLQRLTRWIVRSRAWQSSSRAIAANTSDDPASGTVPLFSRVYVRRMSPEQVYESIRVAVRSAADRPVDDAKVRSRHRRDWVRQFAQAYGTDENDESLDFHGTITQALVMMNGVEVDSAIHQATQAIIGGSGRPTMSATEALQRVALAMLTREPTLREKAAFRNRYRRLTQQNVTGRPMVAAVEDMMWAYLNSSEFVLVH